MKQALRGYRSCHRSGGLPWWSDSQYKSVCSQWWSCMKGPRFPVTGIQISWTKPSKEQNGLLWSCSYRETVLHVNVVYTPDCAQAQLPPTPAYLHQLATYTWRNVAMSTVCVRGNRGLLQKRSLIVKFFAISFFLCHFWFSQICAVHVNSRAACSSQRTQHMVFNPQRKDTSSLYVAGGPLSAGASDRSQSTHFTSHVRSR